MEEKLIVSAWYNMVRDSKTLKHGLFVKCLIYLHVVVVRKVFSNRQDICFYVSSCFEVSTM